MPKKLIIAVVAGLVLVAGIVVGVLFFLRRDSGPAFEDVQKDNFYYKEVNWAAKEGIVGGMYGDYFSPNEVCTRGQAMTFLWRALGSPEPSGGMLNPFPDVPADMYYHDAILWAAERGITHGTDTGDFWPDGPITRAQAVVFLYRAVGSPDVDWDADLPFWDVTSSDYFEGAVRWAVTEKITTGIADGVFLPHDPCTRAQMVTFLYRWFK